MRERIRLLCAVTAATALWPQGTTAQLQSGPGSVQPTGDLDGARSASDVDGAVAAPTEDLGQGSYSYPSPIRLPEERGSLLAPVLPTYSPSQVPSEWGMGWRTSLSISRFRLTGSPRYTDIRPGAPIGPDDDRLTGPWGEMVRGSDGAWYPLGLRTVVRVVASADGRELEAFTLEGSRLRFGSSARELGPLGGSDTYRWYLTDVLSSVGRSTHIDWQGSDHVLGNRSVLFIRQVEYGGSDANHFQYRVLFHYAPNSKSWERSTWISGRERILADHIASLDVQVRMSDGDYKTARSYTFEYEIDPFGVSTLFLAAINRFDVSKTKPTGTTLFKYYHSTWPSGFPIAQPNPNIEKLLPHPQTTLGWGLLESGAFNYGDFNFDGLTDIEVVGSKLAGTSFPAGYFLEWRQTGVGFQKIPPPPVPPSMTEACRRTDATAAVARIIGRLRPTYHPENALVVSSEFAGDASGASAIQLDICTRDGTLRGTVQAPVNSDFNSMNPSLMDVDLDHKPDLVGFGNFGVAIARNSSDDTPQPSLGQPFAGLRFEQPQRVPLKDMHPWTEDRHTIADFNSDGLPDLIEFERGIGIFDPAPETLRVWFGKGAMQFAEPIEYEIPLIEANGVLLDHPMCSYSVGDANGDGLADLITNCRENTYEFTEGWYRGHVFVLWNSGLPAAGARGQFDLVSPHRIDALSAVAGVNLAGTGGMVVNTIEGDIQFANGNAIVGPYHARTRTFRSATDGLLKSVEDGRGDRMSFEYDTVTSEGGGLLSPVLARHTLVRVGQGDDVYSFEYSEPQLHRRGQFLLSYRNVTKRHGSGQKNALSSERFIFSTSDEFRAQLEYHSNVDSASSVGVYEAHDFENRVWRGVSWRRPTRLMSGFIRSDGAEVPRKSVVYSRCASDVSSLSTTTCAENDDETPHCPRGTYITTDTGTLEITTDYYPLSFDPWEVGRIGCLIREQTQSAMTATGRDLLSHRYLVREHRGLVTSIETREGAGRRSLRRTSYNPDGTIKSTKSAAGGQDNFEYEADGSMRLRKFTSSSGISTEVNEREVLTDLPTKETHRRGTRSYSRHFRYDEEGRITHLWDSLHPGSIANPLIRTKYRDAALETDHVASVETKRRFEPGRHTQRVEYFSGGGAPHGSALRSPNGWVVGSVTRESPLLDREQKSWWGPILQGSQALWPTASALAKGESPFTRRRTEHSAGYGGLAETQFSFDVLGATQAIVAVEGFELVQKSFEVSIPNARTTKAFDIDGRLQWQQDADGRRTEYVYDLLGRLTSLQQADGNGTRVFYDSEGRERRIEWDNGPSFEYQYSPGTGLLSSTKVFDAKGNASRAILYEYDSIGRPIAKVYAALGANGLATAVQGYRFYYDGGSLEMPNKQTDVGMLSGVSGTGFSKTFEHSDDGTLTAFHVSFGGWRSVDESYLYYDDGELKALTREISSNGCSMSKETRSVERDEWGRVERTLADTSPFAEFTYSSTNLLKSVDLGGARRVDFHYDPRTRDIDGFTYHEGTALLDFSSHRSRWGQRDVERLKLQSAGVGVVTMNRKYAYTPSRSLRSVNGTAEVYDYDAVGRLSSISSAGVTTSISTQPTPQGSQLHYGTQVYDFDGLGRLIAAQGRTYMYGPSGQLARVGFGTTDVQFLYDERGQRMLKVDSATHRVLEANLGSFVVDDTGSFEPVFIGGIFVGVWRAGVLSSVSPDLRGSVYALNVANPSAFGARNGRPAHPLGFDYLGVRYDKDTRLTRLGARDYDADIARFTTPDPLYLETPDLCVVSPEGCNLTGYADGDPINKSDLAGLDPNDDRYLDPKSPDFIPLEPIPPKGRARNTTEPKWWHPWWGESFASGMAALAAGGVWGIPDPTTAQMGELLKAGLQTDEIQAALIAIDFLAMEISGASELFGAAVSTVAGRVWSNAAAKTTGAMCFAAGTPIQTSSGPMPIEAVHEGDWVWARNEQTGEVALRRVDRTFITPKRETLDVVVDADGEGSETLSVTPDHPLRTEEGWTAAADLQSGDLVVRLDGRRSRVVEVRRRPRLEDVYNFEVNGFHTYFVGKQGILVHNSCKLVAAAREVIAKLPPNAFRPFNCVQCANVMADALKAEGISGEVLTFTAKEGYQLMVSDLLTGGKTITYNGIHQAVRVGDTVFDNFFPEGVLYDTYVGALQAPKGWVIDPVRF